MALTRNLYIRAGKSVLEMLKHSIANRYCCQSILSDFQQVRRTTIPQKSYKKGNKHPLPPYTTCQVREGRGKKRVVATKKKVGKCAECSIIWKSKADSLFCQKVGKRQGEWVGCDTTTCKYWAYVKCADLILTQGKSIKNHSFFCKEHAS